MSESISRRFLRAAPLLCALLLAAGPAPGEEVPITLDTAVRSAIEKNLDLRVETYNPAISDTDIRKAKGIYNPRIGALVDHRGEDAPLDTTGTLVDRRRFFDANLSTDFLLSSGATASAAFTNLWSRSRLAPGTGLAGATAESRFVEPQLSLSLTQPLLQGFGKEVTEKDITVARYGKESSLLQWRNAAISTASNARDQYFALARARENLRTRTATLAVAKEIHAGNQARVKAGVLAEVELLDSDFGVAQREVDLLTAERNVRDASDRLRTTIQYPPGAELIPEDAFVTEPVEHAEERALETALSLRPDLRIARVGLDTQEFNTRVARNSRLPSVALTGSAGLEALGSGYSDALSDLSSGTNPFWSVGIAFAYPLGNDAAEADLAASRLRSRQADARVRSLEESIRLDVRNAIRALETTYRQVDAAEKGVALAEARLASFVKRHKVGLAVTRDVLEADSDLTAAREVLTGARADYQGAITQFYRSTGELLERQGIRIDDGTIDTLAWKETR